MGTVSVSFRVDENEKTRLEKEAKLEDRSESYIHNVALKQYLDRQENRRQMIDQAIEEADNGLFISQIAMHAWVDSWGSEEEEVLPEADSRLSK